MPKMINGIPHYEEGEKVPMDSGVKVILILFVLGAIAGVSTLFAPTKLSGEVLADIYQECYEYGEKKHPGNEGAAIIAARACEEITIARKTR